MDLSVSLSTSLPWMAESENATAVPYLSGASEPPEMRTKTWRVLTWKTTCAPRIDPARLTLAGRHRGSAPQATPRRAPRPAVRPAPPCAPPRQYGPLLTPSLGSDPAHQRFWPPPSRTKGPRMQGAMAAPSVAPVTRQISGRAAPAAVPDPSGPESGQSLAAAVADLPVLDASGRRVLFGALFRERRAVVVFVRVSAGCGTIRSRYLTRRLGRSCFHGLRWGVVTSVPWTGPGPESGARRAWPFPCASTRSFRNANCSSRFLEREWKSSPPSKGHFLNERRGLAQTGCGLISMHIWAPDTSFYPSWVLC